jgi:hypothetical protein
MKGFVALFCESLTMHSPVALTDAAQATLPKSTEEQATKIKRKRSKDLSNKLSRLCYWSIRHLLRPNDIRYSDLIAS